MYEAGMSERYTKGEREREVLDLGIVECIRSIGTWIDVIKEKNTTNQKQRI